MKLEELRKLIVEKETARVEFKATPLLIPSEENRFKIASQLVSFANRHGGFLIFGVNNNGEFEGTKIDEDKAIQNISNIAKDKCSPPVVFIHQHVQTADGDALIIEIERRKGIPHAIVERDNYEIKKRAHYIRTSKGKRLVDDKTLEWLFKNNEDPKLLDSFRFFIIYKRKALDLAPFESPISSWNFVPFFNSLTEENKGYLLEDESSRIGSFLVEVAPFAMLQYLASLFWHSWQIDVFRTKGEKRTSPRRTALEGRKISLHSIPIPENTLISKLPFDLEKVLKMSVGEMMIPPNAEVKVQFSGFTKSVLGIYKEDAFSIEIGFSVGQWTVGLPLPSPLRYKYQRIDIPFEKRDLKKRRKFEDEIASSCIRTTFKADFSFPDVNDPHFSEHFEYGKTILNELEHDWNWDRFLDKLPHGKLFSIEDKIDEILWRLKRLDRAREREKKKKKEKATQN